jgi:hypothetical protein
LTVGVIWSKGYKVTGAEVRELYNALGRQDGFFYLAAAAGFAADQRAQGERLDFGRLFQGPQSWEVRAVIKKAVAAPGCQGAIR